MIDRADFSNSRTRTVAPTSGQHPDYQVNIQMANKMHHKWKASDSPEIWTAIRDSEHHKKCLFTIFFSPDKRAPMGNYSGGVWMHQDRESFLKECESIRKTTLQLFQKYKNQFSQLFPIWKQIHEESMAEWDSRTNLKININHIVNSMKPSQFQGIKC